MQPAFDESVEAAPEEPAEPESVEQAREPEPVSGEPGPEPDDNRPKRSGWWSRKSSFF
jgi:ribonuclease E